MPRILLIIFLSCCTSASCAQTRLTWHRYKTTGPIIDIVEYTKGKVIIHSRLTVVDTIWSGRNIMHRETQIKERKIYDDSGRIAIHNKVSQQIDYYMYRDSIRMEVGISGTGWSDSLRLPQSAFAAPGTPVDTAYDNPQDTILLSKRQLRRIYEQNYFIKHRSVRFYIGLNLTPSIATHMVLVNQPQFSDQPSMQTRGENEKAIFGYTLSIPVGIAMSRRASLYAEYIHLKQGFKSNSTGVDWQTGLPIPATGLNTKESYRFHSNGVGMGYTNSGFSRLFNCIVDIGLYYTWLSSFKDRANNNVGYNDIKSNPVTANLNRNAFIGKLGLGVNYRISTAFELHWLPTLYYNFTPVNNAMFKTRLYNLGFNTGIGYRFVSKN